MIWSYLVLAYSSLFVLGIADNIRGPLYPEVLDAFSLSNSQGSWMFAVASTFGILGGYGSRWVLARWDRVKTLNIALFLMGIGMVGMGFAPTFAWMLFAASFLGISFGLMGVSQNVLAALSAPLHLRSRVLAGLHSMYGLSSFFAPMMVAGLVSWWGSWRSPFVVAGVLSLLLLFLNVLLQVEEHQELKEKTPRTGHLSRHQRFLQIWLATALALYVLAEIMVSTRLALFMRREYGADLVQSSQMVTYFFLGLLGGRIVSSLVHWPGSLRSQMMTSLCLALGCIGIGLNGWPWGFVFCGLAMAPFYPVAVAFMAHEFPLSLDRAMGISMISQSICIVAMHLTVGVLTDLYGLRFALMIGPVAIVLSLGLLLSYPWLKQRGRFE